MYSHGSFNSRCLYLLTLLVFACFNHSALAEDYQVTGAAITGGTSKVIGSTIVLEITVEEVPSGNSPSSVPVMLSNTGGSTVQWNSGPNCTANITPPTTDFDCIAPVGSGNPITYTFTSSEISDADTYGVTADISGPNCSSGCNSVSQVFTIYEPTLTIALAGGGTSVTEGDSGTTSVDVEFTLSELPQGPTFIESAYEVFIGSAFGTNPAASNTSDYTPPSTLPYLTWNSSSGSLTQTMTIDIIGDTISEGPESIYISPGDIFGVAFTGTPPRLELVINDNDGAPPFTPTASISTSSSVGEGSSFISVLLSIDAPPTSGTADVDLVSAFGTATAADFTPMGATVQFSSSSPPTVSGLASGIIANVLDGLSVTFDIPINDDTDVEPTESLTLSLTNAVNINIDSGSLTVPVDILDNDAPSTPIVSVTSSNSINEGGGPLVATVSIDQLPISVASVDVESAPGTPNPASNADFEEKVVTVNFDMSGPIPSSDYTVTSPTSVQINFAINDDSIAEGNEIFDVFLTQQSGVVISSTDAFQNITIIDNDAVSAPPAINVSSQRDFSEDSGQAVITFTRTGSSAAALSFDFATVSNSPLISSAATSSGIATAGADYSSVSTSVSWAAGEAGNKTVNIPIIDDSLFEGDETFQALASNLSGGASFNFDPALAITIIEDDVEPSGELNFSAASYDVNEDAGTATITVTRSGGSNGAVSVSYSSSDDSATAGSDYTASAGTLSWADGDDSDKTFSVPILNDILNETTETVLLTLSNPTGMASLGTQENATLNILNINEAGAPTISKDDISVTDFDGDGLVEVVLDATGKIVSDNPITDVSWIQDGTAIATGMVTSAKLPIGTHPLQVIATDNNGKKAAVDFIAEVKELDAATTRMLGDTPGLNTEQGTVAGALDDLCPRLSELGQQNGLTTGQNNLRNRCEQLRDPDLDNEDIVDALDQIAGEEAEAIIITAARFTNMHQSNLRNRFTQLRRGGSAIIDVSGLNMRLDGGSLSGNMFAAVGRDLIGGGAASGDDAEPEIYSDSRLGLFLNGNVSYGERDRTKNNSGFKLDIEGITAGMDYRFTDKFIGGLAIGYSSSDLDYANDGGILEGSSTFYSAYTSFYSDKNYYIDSSLTYADTEFDVTRHIKYRDMSGLVDLRRGGSTNGEQLLATVDFGWDYNDGPWTFGPNGSFSYSDTSIDGYAERGDSGLELQYSGQDNITSTLGLGFHGSRVFLMDWGVLIANLNGNYYREFKNQNGIIRASFVHDPFRFDDTNPTNEMLIISDIPDRNYFSLGLGLAAQFKYGLSGFIDYQSLLKADDIESRDFSFGLRYEAKF